MIGLVVYPGSEWCWNVGGMGKDGIVGLVVVDLLLETKKLKIGAVNTVADNGRVYP